MKTKSFRKFISIIVVLVMIFSGPISGFAASGFNDTSGHWASSYIDKAVSYGFVKGYLDGSFKPDNPVTRAEFSTMLNGALGVTNTTSISFSDVPSSEWYYTNVRKAVAAGYTGGYEDNTFRPNGKITRQEAAVMISKIIPPYQGSGSLASLTDNSSIADWARSAATKVYAAGYIKGDNNNLYRPAASLSRAEAATILVRLIEGETIVTADTNVSSTTTLRDRIYVNDLTINKALLDNDLTLSGCLILGNLYVNGGGNNTVTLTDTLARNMVVAKTTGDVRVLLTGYSTVNETSLTYGATLEHSGLRGDGFKIIDLNGSSLSTQQVDLVGSFGQVNVNTASIINSTSGTVANLNITSSASGDTVKLSGNYSNVTMESKVNLELLSGKISTLTINSGAASSTVKMSSGTTVTRADVNGKTAFTGTGKISTMYANVNDITYETKPTTITKASGVTRPPTLSNDITAPSPTFTPIVGATNIVQNTTISIVFDEAIYKSNGSAVTTSDIQNIVQLREDTSTGTLRTYTATISSDKKTITITPSTVLQTSQDYYISILSATIEDTLGNENSKITSHFATGTQDVAAPTVTFSPVSGTTNVAISSIIVLTFNEPIYKYSGGVAIITSDFELADTKDIILLRTNNSSGTDVSYTAVVTGTTTKVVTITPHSTLSNNATYYVAVNTNKIKDSVGNVTLLTSATFTTIALNSNKAITSFAFTSPSATGVITEGTHSIAITVPYGTSLTSLTPTIVHTGGSISPNSGVAGNFTNPVTYIVTATDSTTQAYVVTVTVGPPPSTNAGIISVATVTDSTPGTQTGDSTVSAIAWEATVPNSKATLGRSDIVVATKATFNLYSDSAFSTEITGSNTMTLAVGNTLTYIKVIAQDTTTIKYYAVTINREIAVQATPTFSPGAGAVAFGTAVTITSSGADAIYYTLDGTDSATSVTGATQLYSVALTIDAEKTIKAIAIKAGSTNSSIGSASYTQATASAPSSISLTGGSSNPATILNNVSMPLPGATDATGAVTGWAISTASTVKFTVSDAGGTSSITIGGASYTSGSDYIITVAGTLNFIVTTTETGKITAIRTFNVTVTAAP